jgi:cytochrome oxidase Cu insertion factor (SCO1/SenC/PrrC family)
MYKLRNPALGGQDVQRLSDNAFIPFDPANTDFARFKNEIQGIGENGESITPVELQDADGNTMTTEEVAEFITTLP